MIILVPAHNLKTVPFPDCAKRCSFVEIMGAGECESACTWKFDHTGNPVKLKRKKFVPFLERLTPGQLAEFRRGMAALRRRFKRRMKRQEAK